MTGLQRVRVDVCDRGQVEVDADRRAARAPIAAATRSVSSTSSTAPRARFPGIRAPRRHLEPGDVAALLVDRDQHARPAPRGRRRSARRAARGRERCERRERRRRARRPSSRRTQSGADSPTNAGEDAGRGEPLELRAHPLTAPAVSPNAIFRCTSRKKITTGIAVSVDAGHQPAPVGVPARAVEVREPDASASASTGR